MNRRCGFRRDKKHMRQLNFEKYFMLFPVKLERWRTERKDDIVIVLRWRKWNLRIHINHMTLFFSVKEEMESW